MVRLTIKLFFVMNMIIFIIQDIYMRFPLAVIDRQVYLNQIYDLLQDDACEIFIDTNILAHLIRINRHARSEFIDWIRKLIVKDRVATPVWALNEYTNKFIRDQLGEYLSPLKKAGNIEKEFKQLSKFLRMNIDDQAIASSQYDETEDLHNDLEKVSKLLSKIQVTTKSKGADYKIDVHNDISKLFESTIMDSRIDEIYDDVDTIGKFRYKNRIPPGFEDFSKGNNSFGDLVIWFEILSYCDRHDIEKGILITNDTKKDWVYSPPKIIDHGREISNHKDPLTIADPRLIYEFKLRTNSEEFYIISIELLTQILLSKTSGKFIQLAKALQIEPPEIERTQSDNGADSGKKIEKEIDRGETGEDKKEIEGFNYSEEALADKEYDFKERTQLTRIIEGLKTYNWYVQNRAMIKLNEIDTTSIEVNQISMDTLFILGRNIYQAAQGGSGQAIHYMENLTGFFESESEYFIENVFFGMLYEIYFDSGNEFREYRFKTSFLDAVYLLEDRIEVQNCWVELLKRLEPYKNHLLYRPHSGHVPLKIKYGSKEVKLERDWVVFGDEDSKKRDIISILAHGKELLTDVKDNIIRAEFDNTEEYYSFYNLLQTISDYYAIPLNRINVEMYDDTSIYFDLLGKGFGRLSDDANEKSAGP